MMFTREIAAQLMPLFLLVGGALVLLGWSAAAPRTARAQSVFAAIVQLVTLGAIVRAWATPAGPILGGMLIVDHFGLFFTALCVIASIATILVSDGYLRRFDIIARRVLRAAPALDRGHVRAGNGV
jgi:NADH:ubiquinone oxidoreductase subunit 2 (subunit N)